MSVYRLPRRLELSSSKYTPETLGVDMEQAVMLARAAAARITLSQPDTEPFLANLPPDATDYHSYDDLAELVWLSLLSRDDVKQSAKSSPTMAWSSATYAWKQAVCHTDKKFYYEVNRTFYQDIISSTMRRTVISDPAMYEFYKGVKDGEIICGLGKRSIVYLEMLLAGTRPELVDVDWPEEVFEFMGGGNGTL